MLRLRSRLMLATSLAAVAQEAQPALTRRAYSPLATSARGAGAASARPSPKIIASAGPLGQSAAIFGAGNALGFGISALTGSHYHLDLIGTGVFAVSALALGVPEPRQRLSAGAVALWATKLAGFLFYRVFFTKHDARLDGVLSTTSGAFGFWAISFLWGWLVSLPHTLAAGVPVASRPRLGWGSVGSLLLFGLGLLIETAADTQKWFFKGDPANKGKFCDVGVWSISQHPNYMGNIILWTGILLLNAPTLLAAGSPAAAAARFLGASASPLFMVWLFYAQASGSMTNTVELANARYGSVPGYQEYVRDTPLIFPSPGDLLRIFSRGKPE